jgi:hypothetical protein
LEIWEGNDLLFKINLNKKTKISLGNENEIYLNKYTFKTTKLEALKWYNYITRVMFLE